MAMTRQKEIYVEARLSGMARVDAAIQAGATERSAHVRASQLENDPDVKAAMAGNPLPTPGEGCDDPTIDPVEFFRRMMNDVSVDPKVRLEAAKSLAAFTVAKPGTKARTTKKEEKSKKAEDMANKFLSADVPPLNKSVN